MTEEIQELHEHAEHAREHPDLAPVTITMAILAVLVATVSLLGHRTHTEEVILQNKVTDQWAYYQAKKARQHTDELFADLAGVMTAKDGEAAAKLQEKARAEADRYKEDQKELEKQGHDLEGEFALTRCLNGAYVHVGDAPAGYGPDVIPVEEFPGFVFS